MEEEYKNKNGGRQSKIEEAPRLLPPVAQLEKSKVLAKGFRYGLNNWKLLTKEENIDHALRHIFLYLNGDMSEPHLVNAACRLDFAIETEYEVPMHYIEKEGEFLHPDDALRKSYNNNLKENARLSRLVCQKQAATNQSGIIQRTEEIQND